jgi:hypothetical protein
VFSRGLEQSVAHIPIRWPRRRPRGAIISWVLTEGKLDRRPNGSMLYIRAPEASRWLAGRWIQRLGTAGWALHVEKDRHLADKKTRSGDSGIALVRSTEAHTDGHDRHAF